MAAQPFIFWSDAARNLGLGMQNRLPPWKAMRGHIQTIVPYLFRRVSLPNSQILEIPTPDNDVLYAEYWEGSNPGALAILSHGLEGSSSAVYIRALTKQFQQAGWSVLAWNFRGCSGRINKTKRLYHSGSTEDLKTVFAFSFLKFQPRRIQLAGFSLGGNLTLVFLAREREFLKKYPLEKALVVSPPLNLAASSAKLDRWWNRIYRIRFLRDLKRKILLKEAQFPGHYPLKYLSDCRTLFDFDNNFTGPLHGFSGAEDYYFQCSSMFYLTDILTPTKILLAKNDPMLARGNYEDLLQANPRLDWQIEEEGGHCGFWGVKAAVWNPNQINLD